MDLLAWGANVGEEARKNFPIWLRDGFFERYLSGANILDIGFDGYLDEVTPITPSAIGVGVNYPGYDGTTLPFDEASQDAVFVSHCLEHIDDYRGVIADWFRVLRVGGHLIIAVPHQYLYERKLTLPSKFNIDHRRFYTPASLLKEVEEAIDPLNYRVRMLIDNDRGFDYSIRPEFHAVGCYEILLVIEKIRRLDYADEIIAPPKIRKISQGVYSPIPRPAVISPVFQISTTNVPKSIIVFKMDHLGDFLISTPALGNLRQAFADSKITFVCGNWNVQAARDLGIFDEVIGFSLFERNAVLNQVTPLLDRLKAFENLVDGREFDLAIDLRVDSDTRIILQHVRARSRAGIGRKKDFPFLDIALPIVSPTLAGRAQEMFFDASNFFACFGKNSGYEIAVPPGKYSDGATIIYGPYKSFLPATYHFKLLMKDEKGVVPPCNYDMVSVGQDKRFHAGQCEEIATSGVWIDLGEQIDDLEIRVFGRGEEVQDFTFRGCTVSKVGQAEGPHQAEMMAMLVALVQQRVMFPSIKERIE